jgi:hypothetical protein
MVDDRPCRQTILDMHGLSSQYFFPYLLFLASGVN